MLIENKYVVRETRDNIYFTGMNGNNYPVLESLNSRVRTYKSEKAAKMAILRIGMVECCEFAVEYIKSEEVPDIPTDKPTCSLYDELHKLCDKYNISFDNESQGFGAELADLARKFPQDKPSEPPKMALVNDASEWETVFACAVPPREPGGAAVFSRIALCRRQVGEREIFGVLAADGKLYSAGLGGGETALRRFLEEYYNYLLPRVTRESR